MGKEKQWFIDAQNGKNLKTDFDAILGGCATSWIPRRYIGRGPIVAQILITLDSYRERHRDHNRILSQQSASVRDERVGRYPNVYARTRSSQIGVLDRDDLVKSRHNHNIKRMTVFERETRSWHLKLTNRDHIAS